MLVTGKVLAPSALFPGKGARGGGWLGPTAGLDKVGLKMEITSPAVHSLI
jgi:hypothetical protein